MALNALKKRLSRLENAYGVQEEDPLQRMLTKAARLTPEERRARITELENRLLVANGMEPTPENRFEAMRQLLLKRGTMPPARDLIENAVSFRQGCVS
jgi:hypothetical protein